MDELLPVGSIIKVKDVEKPLMISAHKCKFNKQIYDYLLVPYPIGFINSKLVRYSNDSEIEEIYFIGYRESR